MPVGNTNTSLLPLIDEPASVAVTRYLPPVSLPYCGSVGSVSANSPAGSTATFWFNKRLTSLGNFTTRPVTTGALPVTVPTGTTVRLNCKPALLITTPLASRTTGLTVTLPSGATNGSDRVMSIDGDPTTGTPVTVQTSDAGLNATVRSWRIVKVSVLVVVEPAARLPSTTLPLITWVVATALVTLACAVPSAGVPFKTVIR